MMEKLYYLSCTTKVQTRNAMNVWRGKNSSSKNERKGLYSDFMDVIAAHQM